MIRFRWPYTRNSTRISAGDPPAEWDGLPLRERERRLRQANNYAREQAGRLVQSSGQAFYVLTHTVDGETHEELIEAEVHRC